MRFKRYLTEAIKIPDSFEKECSQIIALYKKINKNSQRVDRSSIYLWRGLQEDFIVKKKNPHLKNRWPGDTPITMHNAMNKALKKRFGWPVRNGVSVSVRMDQAINYGVPYVFFPVNGFKWATSGTFDLYNDINQILQSVAFDEELVDDIFPDATEHVGTKLGDGLSFWIMKKQIKAVRLEELINDRKSRNDNSHKALMYVIEKAAEYIAKELYFGGRGTSGLKNFNRLKGEILFDSDYYMIRPEKYSRYLQGLD